MGTNRPERLNSEERNLLIVAALLVLAEAFVVLTVWSRVGSVEGGIVVGALGLIDFVIVVTVFYYLREWRMHPERAPAWFRAKTR